MSILLDALAFGALGAAAATALALLADWLESRWPLHRDEWWK